LKPDTLLGIFSPYHQDEDIASDGPKLLENQNQSLSQHLRKSQIKEKARSYVILKALQIGLLQPGKNNRKYENIWLLMTGMSPAFFSSGCPSILPVI